MTSYDKNTGVVYTETTSAPVTSMVPKWMYQARGKRKKSLSLRRRGEGCASLQDIALRHCVWNSELLLTETLRWAGWHYAEKIYQELLDKESLTFNDWNRFHDAFPKEIRRNHAFTVLEAKSRLSRPARELPSMVNRLKRLDTSLLTFLCINGFHLTFDDLMSIIDIPALAGLVMHQKCLSNSTRITAKNYADWSRAALERGACQRLRFLCLYNFGVRQDAAFVALADFPCLTLLGVTNKTRDADADVKTKYGDFQLLTEFWRDEIPRLSKTPHPNVLLDCRPLIHDTARSLYSWTSNLLQPPGGIRSKVWSTSIDYKCVGHPDAFVPTFWYFRDPENYPKKPLKHPNDMSVAQSGPEAPLKKRQLRSGKQKDVGSLLGGFA